MASNLGFFDRELTIAMTGMDEAAMQKEFVAFAKSSVAELIASGQASPSYDTYVNNHLGPIESVVLPGPALFIFNNFKLVIETALSELQRRVPRRTGRYAGSFVVLVNKQVVTDFSDIPPDAEIIILNAAPYTRRMETGANKTGARHFDLTKAALNRRFSGVFNAQLLYLNVSGGVAPGVPYILKRSAGRRKDRAAGQPITYPALVINAA